MTYGDVENGKMNSKFSLIKTNTNIEETHFYALNYNPACAGFREDRWIQSCQIKWMNRQMNRLIGRLQTERLDRQMIEVDNRCGQAGRQIEMIDKWMYRRID